MARPTDDTPERGDPSLNRGVLRESDSGDGRLILWAPAERHGRYQHWRRVSTVPGAATARHRGLVMMAATMIQARQPIHGFSGRLLSRLRRGSEEGWLLPNGGSAEKCGERQTGQFLVWSSEGQQPPGEKKIRECLPNAREVWPLGPRLFSCGTWRRQPTMRFHPFRPPLPPWRKRSAARRRAAQPRPVPRGVSPD